MKKLLFLSLCLVLSVGLSAQRDKKAEKASKDKQATETAKAEMTAEAEKPGRFVLRNKLDSVNYANGVVMAANILRQLADDIRKEALLEGFKAALSGGSTLLTQEESNKLFSDYTKEAQSKANERHKSENVKFLEENKKRTGVTTTASGLQYEVLTKGSGAVSPKATDEVEVHYTGTLIDGTIFDSSVQRGQTAKFPLNRVIAGWTEGLQYMKEGDKFKFFIPSNLGYGERGSPPKIKGNSTLVFEVELFKVTAKQ